MKPRYAIVRVDGRCPRETEMNWEIKCVSNLNCSECKIRKKYGDTKEQLIKKVAQAIFQERLEWYKKNVMVDEVDEVFCKNAYEYSLALARKIIEFLGVEE